MCALNLANEEHDNSMTNRTVGAICLGLTGSERGTHWFMCVASGARITRSRWTPLPMPKEVIQCISEIGRLQGAPTTLTFGDRHAREIEDNLTDLDNHSDDGSYEPSEPSDDDDFIYDSDNVDDSADIDADIPELEESDEDESVASNNDKSVENTGVESNDDDDDKSVEKQEWRMTTMTTTTTNLSKTQECTDPQSTNDSLRQKRLAEPLL